MPRLLPLLLILATLASLEGREPQTALSGKQLTSSGTEFLYLAVKIKMSNQKSRPAYYRNPPVVERVITVLADVPDETFERRFDQWKDMITDEYPIYEPLHEWKIHVEKRDGIPIFNTARPELIITPRFSKAHSTEGYDWSIRCPAGMLTVNMHSKVGQADQRRYHTLRSEFERRLPIWSDHFDIRRFNLVRLHYVNMLNLTTVPQFFTEARELLIEKIITVFAAIPGEHRHIIEPYHCVANLQLGDRPTGTMQIELGSTGVNPAAGAAIKLDLVAQTTVDQKESTPAGIMSVVDWAHEQILRRFEVVFTEEAKRSFQPVNDDSCNA